MCGIAVSINAPIDTQLINSVMGHRGPDERNEYKYKNVHLYHLRLSIQDIGGGTQPMHLDDRYSIVFNGEIYNHQELKKQFNLVCDTSSDTETLLRLYEKFGEGCLSHLDGMFAFALYNYKNSKLPQVCWE